mmetsp:Transcript_18923/g.28022  ORF Transcript_18923/g.28022 Transcript_18923/m.28022 type:complete len:267 (+) Transcript_18923:111-911(+)
MTLIPKSSVIGRFLVLVILFEYAQSLVAIEKTKVIIFHKPPNVVTSHQSQDERLTVYEELQHRISQSSTFEEATGIQSKLHAIGRLDVDTTGLILLTNDGGLVHHVTNPTSGKSSITKTYEALIMGCHTDQTLESLLVEGIALGPKYGGMTQAVDHLEIISHPTPKSTIVSLTIREGKNRQIRRMFHAIGSGVMKLKRTHVGKLSLEGMVPEEGQWKLLSNAEIQDYLEWEPRPIRPKAGGAHFSSNDQNRHGSEQKRRRRRRRRR